MAVETPEKAADLALTQPLPTGYAQALEFLRLGTLGNARRLDSLEVWRRDEVTPQLNQFAHDIAELKVDLRNEIKLTTSQAKRLADGVRGKVKESGAEGQEKARLFARLWRGVKNRLDVETYREIPRHLFRKALEIVAAYDAKTDCFTCD